MKNSCSPIMMSLLACVVAGAAVLSVTPLRAAAPATGGAAPGVVAPGAAATGNARGGAAGRGGFGRGNQTPPGPPAPVPPEVAIPRPSAEELARINADLRQFVETSSDKDLLKKYESLLTVSMPPDNPCIRPTQGGGRHAQLVNTANTGDYEIMFVGDSITELLGADNDGNGNPGGKAIVDNYFAGTKFANFGISGDTTQGVLWRFKNGEGQGHKPKAIMLMLGTNNMNGNITGPMVAEGIGAVVLELRNDFPDARIMLLAIFPRGAGPTDANRRKVEGCNKIIAKLDDGKHVFFTNLNDKFLTPEGQLIGFRTTDHLHPVTEGFEIWISSVAPKLKEWAK